MLCFITVSTHLTSDSQQHQDTLQQHYWAEPAAELWWEHPLPLEAGSKTCPAPDQAPDGAARYFSRGP